MRAPSRQPLHMVSAWAAGQRVVLAQEAVDEKSNKIVAISRLLERLQLAGALVTVDAMGTQTDIAERIVAGGGDYLLALKAKGSDEVAGNEYVNLDRRQSSSAIGRGSMPTPAHHEASSP
jgi:hypothetical protein